MLSPMMGKKWELRSRPGRALFAELVRIGQPISSWWTKQRRCEIIEGQPSLCDHGLARGSSQMASNQMIERLQVPSRPESKLYSPIVRARGLVFVAGQTSRDSSGKIVHAGNFALQAD
jgi:enamine deaminase RidA (YjgF/YER057c/UK114 family)